jgi:hypothetical protein
MTYRIESDGPVRDGPVLAGILAAGSADDVLRFAFAEADRRRVAVEVLDVGPERTDADLVDRWATKYPSVPVVRSARVRIDPAITLTGASASGALLVLAEPAGHREAAVVRAVSRRAHCPVAVVPDRPDPVP